MSFVIIFAVLTFLGRKPKFKGKTKAKLNEEKDKFKEELNAKKEEVKNDPENKQKLEGVIKRKNREIGQIDKKLKYLELESKYGLSRNSFVLLGFLIALFSIVYEANSDIISQNGGFVGAMWNSLVKQNGFVSQIDAFSPNNEYKKSTEYIVVLDISGSISSQSRRSALSDSLEYKESINRWYQNAKRNLDQNYGIDAFPLIISESTTPIDLYKIKTATFLSSLDLTSDRVQIWTLGNEAKLEYTINPVLSNSKTQIINTFLKKVDQRIKGGETLNSNFTALFKTLFDKFEDKRNEIKLIIFSDLLHDIDGGSKQEGSLLNKKVDETINAGQAGDHSKQELKRILYGKDLAQLRNRLAQISRSNLFTNIILLSKNDIPKEDDFSEYIGDEMEKKFGKNIHFTDLGLNDNLLRAKISSNHRLCFFYTHNRSDSYQSSIVLGDSPKYRIGITHTRKNQKSELSKLTYQVNSHSGKPCTNLEDNVGLNEITPAPEGEIMLNDQLYLLPNCQDQSKITILHNGYPILDNPSLPRFILQDEKNRMMYILPIEFVKIFPLLKAFFVLLFFLIILTVTAFFIYYFDAGRRNMINDHSKKIDQEDINRILSKHDNNLKMIEEEILGNLEKNILDKQEEVAHKLNSIQEDIKFKELINEIKVYSTIRSEGGDDLKIEKIDFSPFWKRICKYFDLRAKSKGINFNSHYKLETKTQIWVDIDVDKFLTIISHMFTNALAATPTGKEISIEVQEFVVGYYSIIIKDSGNGIPEKDHEKIFEPGYSTKNSGAGIGLFLARHYAKKLNGSLKPDKGITEGCIFRFNFPKAQEEKLSTQNIS